MSRDVARFLGAAATLAGAFVVISELPFWASRSSLAPVLTALGVGLICVGLVAAIERKP